MPQLRRLLQKQLKNAVNNTLMQLRREPFYHKLQYSKVPKFDVAAALFGVITSAFVGYLTLSTFGSAGADLTDMLVLIWYAFMCYKINWFFIFLGRESPAFVFSPYLWFWFVVLLS